MSHNPSDITRPRAPMPRRAAYVDAPTQEVTAENWPRRIQEVLDLRSVPAKQRAQVLEIAKAIQEFLAPTPVSAWQSSDLDHFFRAQVPSLDPQARREYAVAFALIAESLSIQAHQKPSISPVTVSPAPQTNHNTDDSLELDLLHHPQSSEPPGSADTWRGQQSPLRSEGSVHPPQDAPVIITKSNPAIIPVLLERIKTDPKDAATLATLVSLNPEGVSAALIPALEGENLPLEQPVYNAGMAAIARDKTPEGRTLIEKKLGSLFEKDRVAATYAIGFTADRAFNPTLEKLLSDGSMSIRRQAALALAEMRDPSLLPILAKSFAANQDVELRVNLILAMQNTGDPAAIKQLQLQLMGGDAKIRRAAIDAVIGLKSPDGVKALTLIAADPDPALRWHIAKGIYLLDPAANDALLKKAMLDAPEEGFLATIADLPESKRLELYESILRSERATLALQIVEQAAKTRTPNDMALIRLAFDESPKDKVQQAAIQALSVSPLSPPDLGRFKKLVDHKDRAQRLFALQTLLRFDPGSADDVFLTATKDADPFIQVLGIYGLAPR